jgi:peroxiredoxin
MDTKKTFFKSGIALAVSLLFFINVSAQLTAGYWQGVLLLNDSTDLRFRFEVKYDLGIYSVDFINAEERISTNEIAVRNDSVFIKMPVFDSEFRCKKSGDKLTGVWINHTRKDKNIISFIADRCLKKCEDETVFISTQYFNAGGTWECDFSPGSNELTKAKGVFVQTDPFKQLTGTFLTETGDYRYLEGKLANNRKIYLSCFDGAHAFVFTGNMKGDSIVNGHFYSGAHHHENWIAKRNDKFQLRNPDSLTYLKPGFTKVDFSFKNPEGKTVSLNDKKYNGKVVIVQLMGSWCPNCMDETKFLASFYDKYKPKGLEVVGLAFERTDDFNKAVSNVNRMKNRFNADYEFLITMKTGADQASEALPMLNKIMAFPTTIYIDKKGVVRKIYTGFYGPATGNNYSKYVEETTRFVEKLLAE